MKKSKNESPKAERSTAFSSVSWLLHYIAILAQIIYGGIKNSLLGKIFTSYEQEEYSYDYGFIKHHFSNNMGLKRYSRTIRKHLSQQFEGSFILNGLQGIASGFITMPLRLLGNFFFSFGIYTVIIYLLRLLLPVISTVSVDYALVGVIICGAAIPMVLSRDNIAVAVGKSVFLNALFADIFGYRGESFRKRTQSTKFKSAVSFVLGLGLGLLTLLVHPLAIIGSLVVILLIVLVFTAPEIGIIIALFGLPFLSFFEEPTVMLAILVFLTFISYCVKLIRGKRILRFEIIDLSVLLFALLIFLSGAISAGGIDSYKEALVTVELMLGYFITVNLMRTAEWIKRCAKVILASGTIVSLIGIVQYVTGVLPTGAWLDTDYFYDISGRAVSLFDNPNVLAIYLVLVLPFALYFLLVSQNGRPKILSALSLASVLGCLVLTWSRGAWISAIICILCFFLVYSRNTVVYLVSLLPIIPIASIFIPDSVSRRFLSIGDLADSSTMYRVYTWRGTLECIKDNIFGGIGYGTSAFQSVYPQYAYAGIESAQHSHSLFLQILLGTGIVGLLVFGVVMFLFMQMNFGYIKDVSNSDDVTGRLISITCMSAAVGLLTFGLFDYSWYSYRVFFMFWVIIALSCAYVRVYKEEQRKKHANSEQT